MGNKELFTRRVGMESGVYGASDEAATPENFCIKAENCDFSRDGVIRKRPGYYSTGGLFPLRFNHIKSTDFGAQEVSLAIDSQPLITFSGSVYPYSSANQFTFKFYLTNNDLEETCCWMSVSTNISLTGKIITLPDGTKFKVTHQLSDNVYLIPLWAGQKLTNTVSFSPTGTAFSSDPTAYRGLALPTISEGDVEDLTLDASGQFLTIRFQTTDHGFVAGDKLYFENGVKEGDYLPARGEIVSVTNANREANVFLENPDPRPEGTLPVAYFTAYYIRNTKGSITRDGTWEALDFTKILSCNELQAIYDYGSFTATGEQDYRLFFVDGVYSVGRPPSGGCGNLFDELVAANQNSLFSLGEISSVPTPDPLPVTYTQNKILGVVGGKVVVEIDNSDGRFREGGFASWTIVSSLEDSSVVSYEIVETSSTSITLSVEGTRLFVPASVPVSFTQTTNVIMAVGHVVAGQTIVTPDEELTISRVWEDSGLTYIQIPKEIEYSFETPLSVRGTWKPLPIGTEEGQDFDYQGLNPEIYTDEYSLLDILPFGDRLYIATGENVWRYNGRNVTSMNFGAPPMVRARKVFGSYGSLPSKSDSSGSYAEKLRLSVTYYWEDTDGKGMESTYISSEDLTLRPGISEYGDATLLELQVPSFPEGLGVPAEDVKIRVYGVSEEADTNIMTLIEEKANRPDASFVTILLGERFTNFFGTYAKDQAFPDVARDSPLAAPKTSKLAVANGCLVAAGATSEPRVEFICDKLFRDTDGLLQDNYRLKFLPYIGEEIDFIGFPGDRVAGTPESTSSSGRGFEDVRILKVSSTPPVSHTISSIAYDDASNAFICAETALFATRYFNGTPGGDGLLGDAGESRALLHPVGSEDISGWSINMKQESFQYYDGIFTASKKQTEQESLTDIFPTLTWIAFGEQLRSGGDPYKGEPVVFVLSGKVYLGTTSTYDFGGQQIDGLYVKVQFWNSLDDTLGNLVDSDGKLLSWKEDLVWRYRHAHEGTVDINGETFFLHPLEPVSIAKENGNAIYLDTIVTSTVDVTHSTSGNTHGSVSLMVMGETSDLTIDSFGSGKNFTITVTAPTPSALLQPGETFKLKIFNNDGEAYIPDEGMIDTAQVFEVLEILDDPEFMVKARASSAPDKPIYNPTLANNGFFITAYDNMLVVPEKEIGVTGGEFELLMETTLPTGSLEINVGDWAFLQMAGQTVDNVYLDFSGYFKVSSVNVAENKVTFDSGDTGFVGSTLGDNTLSESYVAFGKSNIIPVPLPRENRTKGMDVDFAYQFYTKEDNEGSGILNSLVDRFTVAINTVLDGKARARWGSAPTGDFASDYLPQNGFQVVPKTLVNRYSHIENSSLLTVNIDEDKYNNPVDFWQIGEDWSTNPNQIPWAAFGFVTETGTIVEILGNPVKGVATTPNATLTYEVSGNTYAKVTYTDVVSKDRYWWTSPFYGAGNEVRLPIFTFLGTDTIDSSDPDGITDVTSWNDTLVISKPDSLWKAIVGDNAEKRRIESPVGNIAQMVSTSEGVYFLSKHGVYVTDGNNVEPIRNMDRLFRDSVRGEAFISSGKSFDNKIRKTLYVGVPYDAENGFPNARFRFSYETGAWSVDTQIFATSYCEIDGVEHYSSYDGKVYRERKTGNIFSDDQKAIPFKLRSRYIYTVSPDVKFWRQFILYLGADSGYTLNVSYSKNFERSEGDYQTLEVKPTSFGNNFGKSFGGSAWVAPYRVSSIVRSAHVSLSFENNERDSPVEIFSVWLEGQVRDTRPVRENYHHVK